MASHFRWASLFIGTMAIGMGAKILGLAASVEQAGVAFKTLVGEKAGGELLGWLTKYSLVTPVTRQQLMGLTQTMLGYNHTATETKKAMIAVVETASALGITETRLQAITYNLGQIATSTTVSYREFRDLQKQGVNTAKLLASAVNDGQLKLSSFGTVATVTGGATKKLTTAYGKAKEVLEDSTWKQAQFNDQIKKAITKYGEADYHVTKLKDSQGDWNEKVVAANKTTAEFTTAQAGAGKAIKISAENLKELTREQQEAILKQNTGKEIALALEDQMIKTYGGAALRQVKTFSGAMSNFGDVFQYILQRAMGISLEGEVQIGGAFDKIRNAAAKLVEFLIDNVDKIAEFFNKFLADKNNLIAIAGVFVGMLLPAIISIIGPIVLLGGIIGFLVAKSLPLIQSLADRFGGWGNIIQTIKGLWESFSQAFGRFIAEVAPPFIEAFKQMQPALQQFGEAFMQFLPILGIVLMIIGALLTGLLTALAKVLPNIIMIFTGIIQFITGFFQLLWGLFTLNGDLIKEGWNRLWQGIWNIVSNAVMGILNLITGFVEGIVNFFKGLIMALVGGSIIPDMVNGMIMWFTTLKDKVLGLVGSLAGGIRDKFLGLVGEATSWGSGIIRNMINGIKSAIQGAGKLAGKLAGGIGMSIEEILRMQHGGIVPGMIGQPVPIMAHGGERIIPRGSNTQSPSGGGGGVTINMNGPISMDSPQRVKELADTVIRIMGRQSELAKYGQI